MRVRVLGVQTIQYPDADEELIWMSAPPADRDPQRRPLDVPMVQELRRERRLIRDDVVTFERDAHTRVREIETSIPLLRLHCPKHQGCTATERLSLSTEASLSIRLNLPGLAQANAIELKVVTDQSWTAEDGQCLEIVVPAIVTLTYGQFFFNGSPLAIGFNLGLHDLEEGVLLQREIATTDDLCNQAQLTQAMPISGRSRIAVGASDMSIETKATLRGRQYLSLSAFGENLAVSIGYERVSAVGAMREYHLTSGAEYQAYVPHAQISASEAAEIFWHTHQLEAPEAGQPQAGQPQAG